MTSAQQQATFTATNCEFAFDNLTRRLYATDASIYEIQPVCVAFPKSIRQASAVVEAAAHSGLSVIPRGAGTGLAGGAIGEGVVIDFSRYLRQISDLDLERRTVRAGPGVILDQLNRFLRPHNLCFVNGVGPRIVTYWEFHSSFSFQVPASTCVVTSPIPGLVCGATGSSPGSLACNVPEWGQS
jgi:FAD/FMN-containing dehydrogenase